MTVLHVVLRAGPGGTESLCLDLMRNMDPARFRSELAILTAEEGPLTDAAERLGVPVHRCGWPSNALRFLFQFARLCRTRNVGAMVIYAFGLHPLVAFAARLGGVRRIVTSVGSAPPAKRSERVKLAVLSQLARPFVNVDVACSQYVRRAIVSNYRLPSSRVAVVWNCCDVPAIAARASAARAVRVTGGPTLLMVSRMDDSKDHELVIRAFARFYSRHRDASLLLAGDGPRRSDLSALVAALGVGDAVNFLGSRQDVPELLGRADLFVFAGREIEGFGIVLAEAMAAGVPVICTNVGPGAEVICDGEAGLAVEPAVEPFALACEALWRDPAARKRLGYTGAAIARSRYDAASAVKTFEEVLAA